MGWFRSEAAQDRAIERLSGNMAELADVVNGLVSAQKRLELEWVETYDKVRHQLSRMARRGDLTVPINDAVIVDPAVPEDDGIDPVSAKILARRNRGRPGATE